MGSKGAAGAVSPQPPPLPTQPSPVCCMCGDQGLTQELFRCKLCLVRSQHRYCSDLYPKAESYRACNWCLREEGAKALPKETLGKDQNTSVISSSSNKDISDDGGGAGGGVPLKLHRGVFSAQLNKPVKKPRLLDRSASDVTDRIRRPGSGELSPRLGRTRQAFRGKVRRYKLLEEVSS